jgi:prepilin peptidase CpaA
VTATAIANMLGCVLFVAAMLHVVVTDLRHRRIRNWLVAAMIAVYAPLTIAAGLPPGETGEALCAAALVFAAGFVCFSAGWIGGGDAKLAPACVLWLGADQALPFLALTTLFGGVMALVFLAVHAIRRRHAVAVGPEGPAPHRPTLPYGMALALAGLILLRDSPWAAAL